MASLFRPLANLDRQEEPTSSDTPPKRRELSQDNPANDSAVGGAEGGAPAQGLPVARELCPLGPPSRKKPTREKTTNQNLVSRFVGVEKADTHFPKSTPARETVHLSKSRHRKSRQHGYYFFSAVLCVSSVRFLPRKFGCGILCGIRFTEEADLLHFCLLIMSDDDHPN